MKILNFGSMNFDHVYQVPHFVCAGETLPSTAYTRYVGGKGLNQSIALAHAGAQVYHAGLVGEDGQMLLDYLNAHGVDTRYVRVIEQPTGHAVIQVEPQGNNCILLFGGANRCVEQHDIEDVIGQFGKGDYLVLQNEVNRIEEMMEAAKQRGMAVVFNPSPIADNLNNIRLEQIDWLILNEVEAREICGERGEADVVGTLRRMFPHAHVVLTLGERGAVYAYGGDVIRQDACRVKAVDTTAAGDTFMGFFVAAIAAGAAVGEAMRDASRAAAIAVTRPGASASIPRAEEVRAARQALGLPEA